jgi:hypothetical protein
MKKTKSLKNEGLFSMADRFVADFFDQLKKGAADQIINKAEKAKLPKAAIDHMKKMEADSERFKKLLNSL